ncbi:helix-turn-helix transcriptional regulator [Bradyrhizobium sp. Tv2a-2]|uniref:response regulator transcription factor n=1 Tax=Bradyrhizobium sp. Tv2a-2 TaxID=113395 RepID=UPI0004190A24|nr:helix-turn-helix transcriptional regulator [Bradyrhizobium sp. Tv2a-2]
MLRTEFFNDFLGRDGLYWGVNAYSYIGNRNIGEARRCASARSARLIANDLSDREIGRRLGIETSTIRTHAKRIFAKLGVRRRGGIASLLPQNL